MKFHFGYKFVFLAFLALVSCSVRQVAYISTTSSSDGFSPLDIEDILTKCRKYNQLHQVTGVLVYHKTMAFQIFEADVSEVEKVFERIQNDPRHRGIIILHDKIIENREFPNWTMLFRDLKYTDKTVELGVQSERSLFKDIVEIGGLNTVASSVIASRKVEKLVEVYQRILFSQR